MRRADLWNAMPIVIALVGAAGALTLAWLSRVFVGLEAGKSCELAPAWRAHLSWWLFILSALLLLGLECDGIRQLRRDRRTRSTFPILGVVALLAIALFVNVFAFRSYGAICGGPAHF
jgi:hypothetical protein